MSNEENENSYEDEDSEVKNVKLKIREMTKFEKNAFEKAKQRHKDNIVQPQIVQGKQFKGQAFISKPDKIIFKDYSIGQPMTQTIYLTNVSWTFNSFKLLQLKEAIRDYFDIFYKPSGPITAGMSVPITIRFIPQLNEDIDDYFSILAQTGQIDIPLLCTCKKAIARIENPEINFGKVIYGEELTKNLVIENKGALETEITMKTKKGFSLKDRFDTSSKYSSMNNKTPEELEKESLEKNFDTDLEYLQNCLKQLTFNKTSTIKGYSSLNLPFVYKPNEISSFELPLLVYFENFLHSPPIEVLLKGECVEVPIYVEKPIYDFQICLLNHTYREKLVFYNRSANAMKIQIIAPKETKTFFEFNPLLGYIQGNSKFEIWVKMTAEKEILNICAKFIKNKIMEIPFQLIGAEQVIPVDFTIKAKLTIDTVQIIPGKIEYGKLFEGTAARRSLSFDNLSSLPQEILFYPLPKEISIEPDLLPIRILPKEKFEISIVYRAKERKKEDSFLNCKIITGSISSRNIKIPYSAEVKECPLEFSTLKIDMPVLQINEKFITNIEVKNVSSKEMIFEFFLPEFEICGLKLTPMVAKIFPEKKFELCIEYVSLFKKLGPFTLEEIRNSFAKDATRNFEYRLQLLKDEEKKNKDNKEIEEPDDKKKKKAPAAPPKDDKPKKLTAQQQKELELEQQRLLDLEKQKEEEEKERKLEIERNYDMPAELMKLGGKFEEFNKATNKYSQHYTWLVPCYFKPESLPDSARSVIYMEISTVSVEKSLVVDRTLINFGEIAVGNRKIEELYITNHGEHVVDLKMDILPLYCGFSVINALREVQPGETKTLVTCFEPHEQQPFKQTLRIFCETSSVSVKLKGSGVKPEVKIAPENGLLAVGAVMIEESVETSFKITNVSNFRIAFRLLTLVKGLQNLNGSQAFSFIPEEGEIDSQKEIEIKVIFKPDRISERFYQLITIDVPNQKAEKRVFVYGKCYPRQVYVHYHKPFLTLPAIDYFSERVESPFDILKLSDEERIFSALNNKILLEFKKITKPEDQDDLCFSRKILIGNCKLIDPKLEKAGAFEITMPKEDKFGYFVCDNTKGAVASGQEIIVNFGFKPPKMDSFIAHIDAFQGFGQWIEQKAELKLSGGFLKPGKTDLLVFEIILRAYINQV